MVSHSPANCNHLWFAAGTEWVTKPLLSVGVEFESACVWSATNGSISDSLCTMKISHSLLWWLILKAHCSDVVLHHDKLQTSNRKTENRCLVDWDIPLLGPNLVQLQTDCTDVIINSCYYLASKRQCLLNVILTIGRKSSQAPRSPHRATKGINFTSLLPWPCASIEWSFSADLLVMKGHSVVLLIP